MKKNAPKSPRNIFKLFELYREELHLDRLFTWVDLEGVTSRQVYSAVHGRAPDSIETILGDKNNPVLEIFTSSLLSEEFQNNIVSHFLSAFPEKKRLFFIHIPKCAGSDLSSYLISRYASLNTMIADRSVTTTDKLFRSLKNLALEMNVTDTIYIHGHTHLNTYSQWRAMRFEDEVFSTVREPRSLVISQINYVLTRIFSDEVSNSPDSRGWRHEFGVSDLNIANDKAKVFALAHSILRHPGVTAPNVICNFLGGGGFQTSIEMIAAHEVEMTDLKRYREWCKERWQVENTTHVNASRSFIKWDDLSVEDQQYVDSIVIEDRKIYDAISSSLDDCGNTSVSGRDVLLRHARLGSLPKRKGVGLSEVEKKKTFAELDVLKIDFDKAGNSDRFVGAGWSSAEIGYRWTNGKKASICVSGLQFGVPYLLRAKVRPYSIQDKLPLQNIFIFIDDIFLAEKVINLTSEIEVICSSEQVGGRPFLSIQFSLPNAARPSELEGSGDDRLLALAFEWMTFTPLNSAIDRKVKTATTQYTSQLSQEELATRFESLGENCEFGLVQRRMGAEPLGLLRFSSSPLSKLIKALRSRFYGMGERDNIKIEVSPNGKEYMVLDCCYGFYYHAWVAVNEQSPEQVVDRECRRVPFLIRKLIEDLSMSEKIFVFHGMNQLTTGEALDLHAAINSYGPSTLLWVEIADESNAAGSVRWVTPGLLKGHLDRFAPGENAYDFSLESWMTVCRQALSLFLDQSASNN